MVTKTSLKPRKMTKQQIESFTIIPSKMAGFSGGIFREVTAGQKWPGLKGLGSRFVLHASNYGVLFMQNGEVYFQDAQGWVEDYRTYGVVRGAQGAVGMANLSVFTVDVLMGIATMVSGAGFTAIVGTDVIKFIQTNKNKFPKWLSLMKALAVVHALAPTLYKHMVYVALKQTIREGLPLLPSLLPGVVTVAMPNLGKAVDMKAKKSGRGLGKLIGKMGVQALKGRLKLFGAMVKSILFCVMQCLKAIPTSIKMRVGDHRKLANDLIKGIRGKNITVTHDDGIKIVNEIIKNGEKIKAALKDINTAIDTFT